MRNKASKIFMVRPVSFGFNEQTFDSNAFQNKPELNVNSEIPKKALIEFDNCVSLLKSNNIDVLVIEDSIKPHTPDSIFPNNWISFHENNTIVLYPMMAENRRLERRDDIITRFKNGKTNLIDLTSNEKNNIFLEGTGSMVFDYKNKIAYACISPRTNKNLFENICKKIDYTAISFSAVNKNNKSIYHTNVMMCIGENFAVLCEVSIPDKTELELIKKTLTQTNHEIITISYKQMNSFAGNMYQLFNKYGKSYIIMSEQAYRSLNEEQIKAIKNHGEIIYTPITTIEKYGGGSVRCMMADIKNKSN